MLVKFYNLILFGSGIIGSCTVIYLKLQRVSLVLSLDKCQIAYGDVEKVLKL